MEHYAGIDVSLAEFSASSIKARDESGTLSNIEAGNFVAIAFGLTETTVAVCPE